MSDKSTEQGAGLHLRQTPASIAGPGGEGGIPSAAPCQPNWDEMPTWTDVLVAMSGDMRDEIARLRAEIARLRLTPEERAAIDAALGWCDDRDTETITALRGLLERLG